MSITSPDTWCSGLYPAYRDTLDRLRLNPIPHIPSKKYPFIYIKHSQGEFALEQIQMDQQHFYIPKVWFPKHVRPTLFISRTMTETNTIIKNPYFPRGWSNGVDQVWVPAPFLKRVFVESGETGSSGVRVAKETVDLARFDPESKRGIVGVWDLRWLRGARWAEWITKSHDLDEDAKESRDVMSTLSDERGFASNREAMFIPEPNDPCQVIFLSVFKWEPRKDPESLLRSFFQTFGLDSGVCLLISTKVSGRGLAQEEVHNHDIVYENILRIASSVEWVDWDPRNFNGKTIQDSNNLWESRLRPMRPPRTLLEVKKLIKISTKERAWDEVPSLYKIADAYVSASHGEGWGLPVHEALAMKLPVIASATTGHNAFLDHETAWPVELELDSVTKKPLKLPVPEEARMDFGPKAAWDLVNWKHLSNCMLDVAIQKLESYQDRDTKSKEIHTKPLNARRLLMKKLSPEVVMKEWAMMLAELVEEKVWN
ncbi:hypothetical protein BDR26DRAFT_140658 [Obelidium mucronatum]|nr:hypothetical protein BDR26DRAFT_140658 [Obelidium mucronatum]